MSLFPEIMMNLQIVSAVPKLHFSANSYLSDENHSAVTKVLAGSGCYVSSGIFSTTVKQEQPGSLNTDNSLCPAATPASSALPQLLLRGLGTRTGVTVTLWAAGAPPGEETETKCNDKKINRDKIKGDVELELEGLVEGPRWKLGRVWLGQDRLGNLYGKSSSPASYQI